MYLVQYTYYIYNFLIYVFFKFECLQLIYFLSCLHFTMYQLNSIVHKAFSRGLFLVEQGRVEVNESASTPRRERERERERKRVNTVPVRRGSRRDASVIHCMIRSEYRVSTSGRLTGSPRK